MNETFLASYYRRLIDAEYDRARLNRGCVLCAFPGLAIMAFGTWFDSDLIRTIAIPFLAVAILCGANSLIQSLTIRQLRRELEAPSRSARLVLFIICLLTCAPTFADTNFFSPIYVSAPTNILPISFSVSDSYYERPLTNFTWYIDRTSSWSTNEIRISISTNVEVVTLTRTNRVLTIIHEGRTNRITIATLGQYRP
jgi:hypothetical protein